MESILNIGIALILWIQALGEWLVGPMQFFSFLGSEEFYLFVAPVLFWCIDVGLGLRVGIGLMISGGLNSVLKLALYSPRPYWIDQRVIPLSVETSFGVPSGHSMNAVIVWGRIAATIRRAWAWVAAIVLIFFIGISRLALAMHFPHDVLAGWLVGALLLWALIRFEQPVLKFLKRYPLPQQIAWVFGASLAMILAAVLVNLLQSGRTLPAEWLALAEQSQGEPIAPLALSGLVSNAGVLFGLGAGGLLLFRAGGFDAQGPLLQRTLRFLVGVVGVGLIWYGLGAILPRGESLLPLMLRYIRYTLIGLWVAYLAPQLFIKLKLSRACG